MISGTSQSSMLMPMMRVRIMCVRVGQVCMKVSMAMRRAGQDREIVVVQMVFVVGMFVVVFHLFMAMRVRVPFREVQPDAPCHEEACDDELQRQLFSCQQGKAGAEEWRDRKIRACACRAEMP